VARTPPGGMEPPMPEGSLAVDAAKQPVLERIDRENPIPECVRLVDQHGDEPRRHAFPHAHGPWQRNGDAIRSCLNIVPRSNSTAACCCGSGSDASRPACGVFATIPH
jgi:hypothetical protein